LCIGSPQHLKTKFGVGYNLEIKLKVDDTEFSQHSSHANNIIDEQKFAFVHQYFPESSLNEIFENRAIYSIPKSSITSIAETFFLLETLKAKHNIEEYSFSQTTLEQIFLQFAKNNEVEELSVS
jgi:ATP-binding cassette subfamily A (ABC1) protein 5